MPRKARLRQVGLDVCTSTVLLSNTDITHEDARFVVTGSIPEACVSDTSAWGDEFFRRDLLAARQTGAQTTTEQAGSGATALREVGAFRAGIWRHPGPGAG